MNNIGWIAGGVALIAAVIVYFWLQGRSRESRAPVTDATSQGGNAPPGAASAGTPAAGADATQIAPAPVTRDASHATPQQLLHALALNDKQAGDPHFSPDPAAMQMLMSAGQEFARIGTETRYTPRRPSLLPQLMEAVHDEDASLKGLSRIIAQDPQLTGELLRTANSALYRVSGNPIESIERAAAMLGTQGLRTLITAALVKPLAGESDQGLGSFGEIAWEHSLYSASAAEAWAARAQDCDPFTAHLLGLMHGLGTVAVYRVMRDMYARAGTRPRGAVIAHALDTQSAVTARRIAANWGLSDRTQEALEAQSAAAPSFEVTPLARALRFGRLAGAVILLCRHQRISEVEGLQELEAAGFSGPQCERIWERLVRAYVRP
jgi:HD-like signal output (HDOD) protein